MNSKEISENKNALFKMIQLYIESYFFEYNMADASQQTSER